MSEQRLLKKIAIYLCRNLDGGAYEKMAEPTSNEPLTKDKIICCVEAYMPYPSHKHHDGECSTPVLKVPDVLSAVRLLREKIRSCLVECENDMLPLNLKDGKIKGKVISIQNWKDFKEVLTGLPDSILDEVKK